MPILGVTYRYEDQVFELSEDDAIYVKDKKGNPRVGGYNHSRAWTAMLRAANENA